MPLKNSTAHTLPNVILKRGDLTAIANALDRSVNHVAQMVYGNRPWTSGAKEKALAAISQADKKRAKSLLDNPGTKVPGRKPGRPKKNPAAKTTEQPKGKKAA